MKMTIPTGERLHRIREARRNHLKWNTPIPEHVVTRVNDHYYVCEVCGKAGSERWAILHQWPLEKGTKMREDSEPVLSGGGPVVLFLKKCESCGAVEERVFEDSWTRLELCLLCVGGVIDQVTMSPASEGDNLIAKLRSSERWDGT